jgi:hypothetical protein
MVDRRRWFAAVASLAAGLFALPGRVAAGFFRRGRCHAPPPCSPVYDWSCDPCAEFTSCGVTIVVPQPNTSESHSSFKMSGTGSGGYGGLTVTCELSGGPASKPNQDIVSKPVAVNSMTNGWTCNFDGTDAAAPVAPDFGTLSYTATLKATISCGASYTVTASVT